MYSHTNLSLFLFSIIAALGNLSAQVAPVSDTETITLPQALQRALAADPRLPLQDSRAEAAEGQIEQADLPPNPVIGAEVENILGTDSLNIVRENNQRYLEIQANVVGRDIGSFVEEAQAAIAAQLTLPPATSSSGAANTSCSRRPTSASPSSFPSRRCSFRY